MRGLHWPTSRMSSVVFGPSGDNPRIPEGVIKAALRAMIDSGQIEAMLLIGCMYGNQTGEVIVLKLPDTRRATLSDEAGYQILWWDDSIHHGRMSLVQVGCVADCDNSIDQCTHINDQYSGVLNTLAKRIESAIARLQSLRPPV